MNKSLKAVTIGDINGIGIRLLINLWKFKRKKIGRFILISNYNIFKRYVEKNNIDLSYSRINNLSDKKNLFDKYLPIFDIKADNNILNTYNSIQNAYFLSLFPTHSFILSSFEVEFSLTGHLAPGTCRETGSRTKKT